MAESKDADTMGIEEALAAFTAEAEFTEVEELLKCMNENYIIRWDEAESIMSGGEKGIVKSGLPEVKRPDEPDNETDVDECTARLQRDDPDLTDINLNNMKRTPFPNMQKLMLAVKENTHLKKLSLANTGLADHAAEPLIEMLETNTSLVSLNIETNYLSGEFMAKLFKSLLVKQSLVEIKCANQGVSYSNEAEKEIMKAICLNEALCKVGMTFRAQEIRTKVDQAVYRNCEIRRMARLKDKAQDE